MAVELVRTCDSCARNDVRSPGDVLVIAVGKAKPRTIDLCPECEKSIWGPMRELLADRGVPIREGELHVAPVKGSRAGRKAGQAPGGPESVYIGDLLVDCPMPDCHVKQVSVNKVRSHLQSHGVADTIDRAAYITQAIETALGRELPFPCTKGRCKGRVRFANEQGVAVHTNRTHGH